MWSLYRTPWHFDQRLAKPAAHTPPSAAQPKALDPQHRAQRDSKSNINKT
ncbi:hypothetical protein [Deefgea rivuli]|nr:hypothetical protein [Deefgea rivuli]